jgi:hypothetical protein
MKQTEDTIRLSHAGHEHAGHGEHADVDPWHHHGSDEGEPQEEHLAQVNTTAIAKWFVLIVLSVVASIAFIVVYFNQYHRKLQASTVETIASGEFVSYQRASMDALSQSGEETWTGLAGSRVQVPVSRAMEKVSEKYKAGSMRLSGALPAGHAPVK